MKWLIWLFVLIIAFPISAQTNPCEDSTFVSLKNIPINDMSQREYDYFMMMSKECAEIMMQDTSKYDIEVKRSSNLEEAQARLTEARARFIYFYIGILVFAIIVAIVGPLSTA